MLEPSRYLHRAPYVTPMSHERPAIIEDGGVLTEQGRILAVGRFAELKGEEATLVEHEDAILTPGLVNCHVHLELSHLANLGQEPGPEGRGGMVDWIRKLLAARLAAGLGEEQSFEARMGLARLYGSGCRALADIGNLPESSELGRDFKLNLFFYLEFLGLSRELEADGLELLAGLPAEQAASAHAPYSTSPALIKAVKERGRRWGHLMPIHVAESPAELDFLQDGNGPFRDFLEERNAWDGSFTPPGLRPVAYLDSLGVLDPATLCVHCVQVDDAEIGLLARRRAPVCLCPGSNRYMGVGSAPALAMHEQGLTLVLGTDSLASNPHLSLWREMALLREDNPGLDPAAVFAMATCNGARVLGIDDEMGSLSPGRTASFLSVESQVKSAPEVFDYLTSAGLEARIEWVE